MKLLEINNLYSKYGKGFSLENITFSGNSGECIAVCGANGSGKSTLISLISGINTHYSGKITLFGKASVIPQGSAVIEDLTVKDNLNFFYAAKGLKFDKKALLPFGLEKLLNKRASALSGGMKKRLSIACALAGDPEILLFDEPSASLDILYREELLRLIEELKARGRLIIYSGHDMGEISRIYDKILLLDNGRSLFFKEKIEFGGGFEELEKNIREVIISRGEK